MGYAWLFFSPASKRVAALGRRQGEEATRDQLAALLKISGDTPHSAYRKKQIGFINTTDCLLSCVYCFNNGGATRNYLHPDIAINVLNEFTADGDFDQLVVKFFGGEPTLNMELIQKVVGFLEDRGVPASYHIVTAGYVAKRDIEWMVEKRFVFTISLDGDHDVQRFQRPLAVAAEGLMSPEHSLAYIAGAGASCKVRMTVTNVNVDRLPQHVAYLHNLGAEIIHIEPVTLAGRATHGVGRPNAEYFSQKLLEAIDEGARLGVQVINSSYMNLLQQEGHYCSAGKDHIVVGARGEISLCYEVADECAPYASRMLVGQYSHQTRKIEYHATTGACNAQHYLSPACVTCISASACGGGCPSRNLADTGDIYNQGGYFCQITREVFPSVLIRIAVAAGILPEFNHHQGDNHETHAPTYQDTHRQ